MSGPLDGLLVVSCEQAVAAPFATRQLADLGARVIKVERPGAGDFARGYDRAVRGLSSHFVWLNRNKESIALDLKDQDDRAVLARLVDSADVFVQNLAPGAIDRLGFGADETRARRPELIWCGISGYGSTGPMRDAKAYDLLIQAEAGLVSITGTEESPAKSGIPSADIAAGMYAFSGILAALYQRRGTGEGATLEINLLESLVEWMGYPLQYTQYTGVPPKRTGTSHAAIAPYGVFDAADGARFVLSVQNEREWRAFCAEVLRQDELTADPRFATGADRVRYRFELDNVIKAVFDGLDGPALEGRLRRGRIAHARLREVGDVLQHPQLAARDRWFEVDSEAGPVRVTRLPIDMEGLKPRREAIPAIGAQSSAIRAEFPPVR